MDIYNRTRIGDDECGFTQDTIQNNSNVDYMLKNFYVQDCTMKRPIEFATSQVDVNFCAAGGVGNQCGLGGCNIDENTALLYSVQTHPRNRISLMQRPFLTVPYLGRGPSNPMLESQLQQASAFTNRKTLNAMSEVSYIPITNYPLIPTIKNTVTNPEYLVERWTRGGDSTRKM